MTIPYILHVHVIPKAAKNQVIGWEKDPAGDRWLKVRVAATPEDGKANKELLSFLGKQLGVPAKQLSISSGEGSRYKRVKIQADIPLDALLETA